MEDQSDDVAEFIALVRLYRHRSHSLSLWGELYGLALEGMGVGQAAGRNKSERFQASSFETLDAELLAAQFRREAQAIELAREEQNVWVKSLSRQVEVSALERARLMSDGLEALIGAIEAEVTVGRVGKPTLLRQRYPALSAKDIGYLTFHQLLTSAEEEHRQQRAVTVLGERLDRAHTAEVMRVRHADRYRELLWQRDRMKSWQAARFVSEEIRAYRRELEEEELVEADRAKVGNQLLFLFLQNLNLVELKQEARMVRLTLSGKATDKLRILRERANQLFEPERQPLLLAAKDWIGLEDGGYYTIPLRCVKMPRTTRWRRQWSDAFAKSGGERVLGVINHLQSTPHRINGPVFELMQQLYRALGQGRGEGRPEQTADAEADRETAKSASLAMAMAGAAHQQQIAHQFYYVWQMDFRGRVYPLAGSINPQGSDAEQALLEFGEACELTPDGERWLALHGANVLGVKLEEDTPDNRIAWVHEHSDEIVACASRPMDHLPFWSGSDGKLEGFSKTAWRALAFCTEWKQARVRKVTRLPVAVDGTCNAIQHFAALTGDATLALKVNLTDGGRKQDIYGRVAEDLRRLVEFDTGEGKQRYLALMEALGLRQNPYATLDRGLCKQPVMTKPYGVKPMGMQRAVRSEFELRYANNGLGTFGEREKVYGYLVTMLEQAMKLHLKSADGLMGWLRSASVAMSEAGQPTRWRTAVGLEVMQAYAKTDTMRVKTALGRLMHGRKSSDLVIAMDTDEINVERSRNGIVANFVHSQDAGHMGLVTLAAKAAGIGSLRMVHDSFACHASRMGALARIIREEFVSLYETDAVIALAERCNGELARLGKPALTEPPARGDFNVREVLGSTYFFC